MDGQGMLLLDHYQSNGKLLITKYDENSGIAKQFFCRREDREMWADCGKKHRMQFKQKKDRVNSCDNPNQVYNLKSKTPHKSKNRKRATVGSPLSSGPALPTGSIGAKSTVL